MGAPWERYQQAESSSKGAPWMKYQASQPSASEQVERVAGRTARSLASGVGQVGDFGRVLTNPLYDAAGYVAQAVGADETAQEIWQMGSMGQMPSDVIREGFDAATDGRYAPQNDMEAIADKAAEYVTGAGGLGMASRAAGAPQAMQAFLNEGGVTGLAGAAGAGAGEEIANQADVNPLVGALLGGVAGGVTGAAAQGLASRGGKALAPIALDERGSVPIPSFAKKNTISYQEGVKLPYHRFTNGDVAQKKLGYAMFAEGDPERVSSYGRNHYAFTPDDLPEENVVYAGSNKFKEALRGALKKDDSILKEYDASIDDVIDSFNPSNIVDSADGWDNLDWVSFVKEKVLSPNNWKAVETDDGALLFDDFLSSAKKVNPDNLFFNESGHVTTRAIKDQAKKPPMTKAERTVARVLLDEQGLNPEQAARQVRAAGTGQVPLTLPERTNNQTLVRFQQRLTENPGDAGKVMGDFNIERQRTALPKAYEQFVRDLTDSTASPVAAGRKVRDAAGNVIDSAVQKRAARAQPFYEQAGSQLLDDAQMQVMRKSSPLFDGLMKKITDDPVYRADLGDAAPNSVAAVDYTKKALDDMIETAMRSGDKNRARILKAEKNNIINAIDEISPAYRTARKVFAENSPRINKLNENVIGMLASVKEGAPEKALSVLSKESPASLRYARRIINDTDPEAWQSIVGAKLRETAEKNNYSPTKILNALSSKTANGNVIRDQQLNAMLTPKQVRAKNTFFEYMNRAQRVRFGSNTATNLQVDDMMQNALGTRADTAKSVIEQASRGDKMGLVMRGITQISDWWDEGVRSGSYEEIARIFVGRGAEDFADRLSKVDPSDLRTMTQVIGQRIRETGVAAVRGERVGALQGASTKGNQQQQRNQQPPEQVQQQITPQSNSFEMEAPLGEQAFTQANEGRVLYVYKDTDRNRAIGDGFNFNSGIAPKVWKEAGIQTPFRDAYLGKKPITEQEAQALYETSMKIAADDARSVYSRFDSLPEHQKTALLDLSYHHGRPALQKNLGAFNKAFNAGRINIAIRELRNSGYARKFPNRANKVIRMLEGRS